MRFGTTIATCILVLKKSKTTNDVVFIDASAEFTRVGNKNKLTDAHRERILQAFVERASVDHFVAVTSNGDIGVNGYALSVSSYVQKEDFRQTIDIGALNADIQVMVARQSELRASIDAIVAELERDQ